MTLKILLIEDDQADVVLLKSLFEEFRCQNTLHHISDGDDALIYLLKLSEKPSKDLPDVIMLDLNLPKKDGREVLCAIKREPSLKNIPVIVLTSSVRPEDREESMKLGAALFRTKPCDYISFESMVSNLVVHEFPRLMQRDSYGGNTLT